MNSAEFKALYERTAPELRAYLRRCVGSTDLADDLLQDTFIRYLRAAPADRGKAQTRGYLYRTADSILADHWRANSRRKRRDEHLAAEGVSGGEAHAADASGETSDRMTRAMQRLKPKTRRLLWLAYVEALSHREIAEILSLKEASIRVLLFRARRALERELEGER